MDLDKNRQNFLSQVFRLLIKNVTQAGPYITASYTLIGSVLLLTLLGYFADRWLGSSPILMIIGIILGLVVGLYEIARVVFKK